MPPPCPPAVATDTPLPPPEPPLELPCWPLDTGAPAPLVDGAGWETGAGCETGAGWETGAVERPAPELLGAALWTAPTLTAGRLICATSTRVPGFDAGCPATAWFDRALAPWPVFPLDAAVARLAFGPGRFGFTVWGLDGETGGGPTDAGTNGETLPGAAEAPRDPVVVGRVAITPTATAAAISAGQVASTSRLRLARLAPCNPDLEPAALRGRSVPDALGTSAAL